MVSTCILLATFDRCVSTSSNVRLRQLNSLAFARRIFVIAIIFLSVSQIFLGIVFDLREGICALLPGLQSIVVTVYTTIFATLVPHLGMLIFGFMTWWHIKQSRNRIIAQPSSTGPTRNTRIMNRHLIIITFLHAILSIMIVSIRCITYSYNVITSFATKSIEQQTIEYFIQQIIISDSIYHDTYVIENGPVGLAFVEKNDSFIDWIRVPELNYKQWIFALKIWRISSIILGILCLISAALVLAYIIHGFLTSSTGPLNNFDEVKSDHEVPVSNSNLATSLHHFAFKHNLQQAYHREQELQRLNYDPQRQLSSMLRNPTAPPFYVDQLGQNSSLK